MSACGTAHPETGALCDMPEGQHQWHTAVIPGSMPPEGVDWPNEEYTAPLRAMTKSGREEHKAMLRARVRGEDPNVLADAKAAWEKEKEVWLREARTVFRRYCQQHDGPFTTPEHIWPLLDAPREMRAFVVVVQHALRRRWIKEVDSKRLRDTYVTRDGKEFQMNKLVPVYRSLITIPKD